MVEGGPRQPVAKELESHRRRPGGADRWRDRGSSACAPPRSPATRICPGWCGAGDQGHGIGVCRGADAVGQLGVRFAAAPQVSDSGPGIPPCRVHPGPAE
jgi:hypothetical protein